MEQIGINFFDLAVIGAVVLGALIGLVTGFLRAGLFVMSWVGAGFATLYGFTFAQPIAHNWISPDWLADIVAGAAIFIVALIALHILASILTGWVRHSRLNALDRSLGLVAGVATAALILALGYLPLSDLYADEQPDWLAQARTRTIVENSALTVRKILPERMIRLTGEALERRRRELDDLIDRKEALERLTAPPISQQLPRQREYNDAERDALDRKIEEIQ